MRERKGSVNCDLSNLPRLSNGKINWIGTTGYVFSFDDGNKTGTIKIISSFRDEKNTQTMLELEYDNRRQVVSSQCVSNGYLSKFINDFHRREYSVGDIVESENGRKFLVLQVMVRRNRDSIPYGFRPYYKVRCLECGADDYKLGSALCRAGCQCCSGDTVFPGFNDIESTDPWLSEYFQDPSEARYHTHGEQTKIYPKCPYCGKVSEKLYPINTIYQHNGFLCSCKETGSSYPEKYVSALLDQLGVKYITQATTCHVGFDVGDKAYDFYDKNKSCIIETHGPQHFEGWIPSNNWRTYEEEHANDVYKEETARQNGIEHYVIIDCRESYSKHIKESILKSELPNVYSFTEKDIDWNKCNKYATSNIVKLVCDDFMKYLYDAEALHNMYHISRWAVRDYIRRGSELGWSNYDLYNLINGASIQVKMYNENETHLFRIKDDLRKFFPENGQSFDMSRVNYVIDTGKQYKGYFFETVKDFDTLLQIANTGEDVYVPAC